MIGIVVTGHGLFAEGMHSSAKMIAGENENIKYVCFEDGMGLEELADKLNALDIHAETDCRSEKLGYKIREAQMQKIPYMLVIGDRDMENGTVSVRTRKGEDLGAMTPDEFIAKCLMEIATKSKEV